MSINRLLIRFNEIGAKFVHLRMQFLVELRQLVKGCRCFGRFALGGFSCVAFLLQISGELVGGFPDFLQLVRTFQIRDELLSRRRILPRML